jgi:Domain of unknown function (DUF222)
MFAAALLKLEDAELVSVIQFWERAASAAAAAQLAAIGELARRRPRSRVDVGPAGHSDAGDPLVPEISEFAVDEVAAALRLSRPAAGARLHVAVELARLPAVATALGNGSLDVPKVRAVVDAVAPLDPVTAVAVTDRVLPRAGRQTVGQLRASLSRAVLAADPGAAERRHERAVAGRSVTLQPARDGMAELWALLPADAAVAVYGRLDTLARHADRDGRTMDARRADALVTSVLVDSAAPTAAVGSSAPNDRRIVASAGAEVREGTRVLGAIRVPAGAESDEFVSGGALSAVPAGVVTAGAVSAGAVPGGGLSAVPAGVVRGGVLSAVPAGVVPAGAVSGDGASGEPVVVGEGSAAGIGGRGEGSVPIVAASVHVTVPAATALGLGGEPGELAGYGPVPASMARRLSTTTSWRKVTVDPETGAVSEMGRTPYTPSAALADLVRTRDATCRFPGCRQPARRCDLDHVVPWPDGPTTAGNLASLCRHHHRLKHQTPWTVRAGPNGELLWTSPAGQRYPTEPAA